MKQKTVREARVWASSFLEKHHREKRVADLMLAHLLQTDLTGLLSKGDAKLTAEVWEKFQAWIQKHVETGKPLEHFSGQAHFYGRTFHVNEHVLIPRPETEELVEAVMGKLSGKQTVVDIGTGSGVIALTLKLERPELKVFATDISQDALRMAQKNADQLGAEVNLLEGNFLEPIIKADISVDVVVSNPPYIGEHERAAISDTVLHDPSIALFADNRGLFAYEKIIEQVKELESEPSQLFFEIGHEQGDAVRQIIQDAFPEAHISVIKDINQKDRIVHAKL